MVTISEILKPRHVDLELSAPDPVAAVAALAEVLHGDNRITNWAEFQGILCRGAAKGLTVLSCGAALCHARTEGVADMLMAAGRLATPILNQSASSPAGAPFRFLFIIGLPPAMAAEYLRVVGALARTLKAPATMEAIEAAETGEDLVEVLSRAELTL